MFRRPKVYHYISEKRSETDNYQNYCDERRNAFFFRDGEKARKRGENEKKAKQQSNDFGFTAYEANGITNRHTNAHLVPSLRLPPPPQLEYIHTDLMLFVPGFIESHAK